MSYPHYLKNMIGTELKNQWSLCLDFIRDNVSKAVFDTWFSVAEPVSLEDGELLIQIPSPFVYEYLEQNCLDVIKAALTKVFGKGTKLAYSILTDKENNISQNVSSADTLYNIKGTAEIGNKAPAPTDAPYVQDLNPQLDPNYSFDNFVEGISNKLARTAGETIALNPAGSAFNPLFIYGSSGVGKTHLATAIGRKVKELHPEKRVLYVSAHLFMVQYTDAARNNTVNDFIHFYQSIDVLIIDDMQELSGYTKTQNTFFHIFNHLHLNKKQIILTADRPPIDILGLEERLLTRFKWGLQAEIEKPTKELRYSILKAKVTKEGLDIPENIISYISDNVDDSIRDLEGFINSLMAYSVVDNCNIDMSLVKKIMPRFKVKVRTEQPITFESICNIVCEHFKISVETLVSRTRKQPISYIRQLTMYLASSMTDESIVQIGKKLGGRNHATIIHAISNIRSLTTTDKRTRQDIETLKGLITSK